MAALVAGPMTTCAAMYFASGRLAKREEAIWG